MAENNPLHEDMRVREYLKFRARLKGLDKPTSRERVEDVIAQFDLAQVHGRMIGELSKGFRQRVGLADALVHEPELLILDEPTIGLDPHQIRTVRQHIKELGKNHTVLISSHILPEVEVTCSRLLIFHEGTVVANDTPRGLEQSLGGRHRITVELQALRRPCTRPGKKWRRLSITGSCRRKAIFPLRTDAARRGRFTPARLGSGPCPRLALAGTHSRTAYAGRYLRAHYPRGRRLMTALLTLARRELAGHFFSLRGYVIMAGVQLLLGASLLTVVYLLNGLAYDLPFTEKFPQTEFFWLVLLMVAPVITMRTFAHEKARGTLKRS